MTDKPFYFSDDHEKALSLNHILGLKQIKPYVKNSICTNSITANSRALCMSLMPEDYKDINLTHQGQFLMPDSQIWTHCSLTDDK